MEDLNDSAKSVQYESTFQPINHPYCPMIKIDKCFLFFLFCLYYSHLSSFYYYHPYCILLTLVLFSFYSSRFGFFYLHIPRFIVDCYNTRSRFFSFSNDSDDSRFIFVLFSSFYFCFVIRLHSFILPRENACYQTNGRIMFFFCSPSYFECFRSDSCILLFTLYSCLVSYSFFLAFLSWTSSLSHKMPGGFISPRLCALCATNGLF